jgi:phage-related protein
MYKIILFEKANSKPVEKFILSLTSSTKAKIIRKINLLEEYGANIGMPHSKKIASNIYELRITGLEEIRLFYTVKNNLIYILHGIKKTSQKIPKKELNVVKKRLTII